MIVSKLKKKKSMGVFAWYADNNNLSLRNEFVREVGGLCKRWLTRAAVSGKKAWTSAVCKVVWLLVFLHL